MHRNFGRALRPLWDLDREGAFLNHGSFGACPKAVLAVQSRIRAAMESQPDVFFRRQVMPREDGGETPLRAAAARLAAFVNAPASRVAFVENASLGVQAALDSIELAPGDEILTTSHTYNAVRLMVEARCARDGAKARVVELPLPATEDEVVARIEAAATPSVRVAIIDHITSPTALVMPLARIVPALRRAGARVIVDGAHGLGQVPIDLASLAPDWYVSNAHKWLYAPRGCALLYASAEVAPITRPTLVSHWIESGFPHAFDWVGTRDYSPWLALPAAVEFHAELDQAALHAHHRRILDSATARLEALGATPIAPLGMCAAMRSFVLPQSRPSERADALELPRNLWDRHRVQAMAVKLGERLLFRVSSQAYVDEEDLERLAAALAAEGWPGRQDSPGAK
jgi:isopenicillin-N epimerase